MTLEEQANEIAEAVAGTVVTVGGYYEVDIEKATLLIADTLTSAEAAGFARGVEAAAQVVVLKARENDMAAKNLKMPEGSASHLAANVYRNAEFAIRALIPETARAEKAKEQT